MKSSSHRPYTILHTESSLGWGGQEHRILAEAKAMRARGHRVLLACDPRGELHRRSLDAGFPVTPLTFGGPHNLSAWLRLRQLLERQSVKVLNTHSSLDSWVGSLAWRSLASRPLLLRTRHLSTRVKNNWPTRWLYRTPAAIITTGEVTRDLLQQHLGLAPQRLFSIPTGVPLEEFSPREKDLGLLAELDIPAGAYVFGTVAVLRSWKGHLFLLEALHQLLHEGLDAYLLVVGDGPYRGIIEEKVAELHLGGRVRLMGHRERVPRWFAAMDAVVLASYANEGVPQSLLQALAMAKPVVGTMVGGIPEVIVNGETGLLAPPRDPQALAQAMRRLRSDPDLARELGRQGRELVAASFSLERMAEEIERVYEVLSERAESS
jgi:glycosyltransferase involved in cell wall biosynthesis